MKLIKINTLEIDNIRHIGSYVKIVDDVYTLSTDESLVIEPAYIEEMYRQKMIDYFKKREIYKYLGLEFSTRVLELKTKIVEHCAVDQTTQYIFYLTQGHTEDEIYYIMAKNKGTQIIMSSNCCTLYTKSPKFFSAILLYLQPADCEKFILDTTDLFNLYSITSLFGQKYGDQTPGIMDFIESYGAYAGHGLLDYTIYPEFRHAELINILKDIFLNGNID